jgi:hypothetical protein
VWVDGCGLDEGETSMSDLKHLWATRTWHGRLIDWLCHYVVRRCDWCCTYCHSPAAITRAEREAQMAPQKEGGD